MYDALGCTNVHLEDDREKKRKKGNPKTPSPITLGYSKLWDVLANPCQNRCRRQSSCRLRITAAVMGLSRLFWFETPPDTLVYMSASGNRREAKYYSGIVYT